MHTGALKQLRATGVAARREEGTMAVSADELRRHYESLSDEALLEIVPGELVPLARACLAEELGRRGLDAGSARTQGAGEGPEEPAPTPATEEAPVCIAEYDYVDEAELARGLLETADIPAVLGHEPGVTRLLVPAEFAEQGLRMLVTVPMSDEELAAQAEAAGMEDEEAEQEPGENPE